MYRSASRWNCTSWSPGSLRAADCKQSWRGCKWRVRIYLFKICYWFCFVLFFWNLLLIFCSSFQHTPLHWAVFNHRTAVCELLIASKADVDANDECAFMFKICYWFCFVFWFWNLLLIFCSSVHWTALHHAAENSQPAVCELLIAGKADVNATNECAFMFKICYRLLRFYCCDVMWFWRLLLIFRSRFWKDTALHRAAHYGYTAVCELLIAGKADVNATNRCAFMFKICFWFCVLLFSCISLLRLSAVPATTPSQWPSKRTNPMLWRCCAALAREQSSGEYYMNEIFSKLILQRKTMKWKNKRFFRFRPCDTQ